MAAATHKIKFTQNAVEKRAQRDKTKGGFRTIVHKKGKTLEVSEASARRWENLGVAETVERLGAVANEDVGDPFKIAASSVKKSSLDLAIEAAESGDLEELEKHVHSMIEEIEGDVMDQAIEALSRDAKMVIEAVLSDAIENKISQGRSAINSDDIRDALAELKNKTSLGT